MQRFNGARGNRAQTIGACTQPVFWAIPSHDPFGRKGNQEADQRLSLPLPACTIRTMELTIIDRASLSWLRPWSSECSTRSAAVEGAAKLRRLAGERSWWGARESKAAQQGNPWILANHSSERWPPGESLMRRQVVGLSSLGKGPAAANQ
jgi:hypothetical protein